MVRGRQAASCRPLVLESEEDRCCSSAEGAACLRARHLSFRSLKTSIPPQAETSHVPSGTYVSVLNSCHAHH